MQGDCVWRERYRLEGCRYDKFGKICFRNCNNRMLRRTVWRNARRWQTCQLPQCYLPELFILQCTVWPWWLVLAEWTQQMGLLRMLICKKQYEAASLRSLFLCKSSHLCVVTSVLPLNIIKFFPSLSARAAAHFGCMVGRYFLVMPKTRWNISLNGEQETPGRQKVVRG